jgi:FimV-like protein
MLRLFGPTLLTLSLAFPSASFALGLGDIHVESTLHQTLVARIDLVGAASEDLPRLTAGIASDEIFHRYNLERPAFLAGTTVVIGKDGQGRPVLVLRSSETFTEPLVTFLVALHSPIGEMIREYTVLLDPAGFASKPSSLESTPAAPAAEAVASTTVSEAPERAATAPDAKLQPHTYTVARRDTLDRIARIAGAHSRSERHRMMIAIFRANPGAFQNNFNALHSGTTLQYPTEEQLSAISTEDAAREYEAQMATWHASNHRKSPTAPVPVTIAPTPILDAKPDSDTSETDRLVLTERVESLEKALHKLRQELKQPLVLQTVAPVVSGSARSADTLANQSHPEDPSVPATRTRIAFASLAAFGLVLAAGAWFMRRRWNGGNHPDVRHAVQQSSSARTKDDQSVEADGATPPLPQPAQGASRSGERVASDLPHASSNASTSESGWFKDSFSTPIGELLAAGELADKLTVMPGAESPGPAAAAGADDAEATQLLSSDVKVAGDTVEQKFSFFTPDSNTNITHVIVGSGLEQPRPFVERRKSPVDVLRQAIEREPHRSDLCLKLLELYYTAAAENRRAFLEASHHLAKNDKLATEEDWSRIAAMGRAIAPDDELFCDSMDKKAVA